MQQATGLRIIIAVSIYTLTLYLKSKVCLQKEFWRRLAASPNDDAAVYDLESEAASQVFNASLRAWSLPLCRSLMRQCYARTPFQMLLRGMPPLEEHKVDEMGWREYNARCKKART